jgi:riboflavin kinase/FMN adenylyltransferase
VAAPEPPEREGLTVELFEGIEAVPAGFGPTAVTIGKFDGVHRGHRAVLQRLLELARARDLAAVAVTFDRNPLRLLKPEICPDPLVSNAQKAALLAETGVDATVVLTFDRALSELPAEDFVRDMLVGALGAKLVLAGSDFRFGARGAGDIALLQRLGEQLGFEVASLDDVTVDGGRVSSTTIRAHLADGKVRDATALLGRYHRIRSTVVHGDHIGRELGYPTANLDPAIEGFLPVNGVYAVFAWVDGVRYPAAVSIGNNPTFDGVPDRQVEAHLFDQRLDLYGRTIELDFVEFIRPMVKFGSVPELVEALDADAVRIRAILADEPPLDATSVDTPASSAG